MKTVTFVLLTGMLCSAVFASGSCSPNRAIQEYDTDPGTGDVDMAHHRPYDFAQPCTGLVCQKPKCGGGGNTTTLSGTVFAPNGVDPLYNVLVFVPNGELKPFDDGVTCETCEKSVSGTPLTAALTDTKGRFVLKDMPAGANIPLVVQIGRFRRKITIPFVSECTDTLVNMGDARLPRNSSEGDIPRIAIVTSTYDPTECILNAIGIDANEFTNPSGTGRVHIYHGNGNNIAGAPAGSDLWGNIATLKKYQLVALPCSSYPSAADPGVQNLFDYANAGGRLFITDLSYPVISQGKGDWPQTGNFASPGGFSNPASIDTSFPKGKALSDWLEGFGAATGSMLSLSETYSRVGMIKPPAQRWLYSGSNTQSYTFNTPTNVAEKDQCGRVYYSSFHIGSGRSTTGTFPSACHMKPLTAQERVLEFMLFDLTSCVQSDSVPPVIP